MGIIEIRNLNFGYKKSQTILSNLDMKVEEGSVYGFLGANGAGKSTTIRNLLGLLKPREGSISLFEKDLKSQKPKVFEKIGCLIESPSLYFHLNAVQNLKIACNYLNVPHKRIAEVLEMVNLTKDRNKKTGKYSTGMKQRLGLAIAILKDPELLILDEPTNGLDPNGITEIRQLIKKLQAEGKTILLSSHILSEIEKIASHVGIIKNGKMVFEDTIENLYAAKGSNFNLSIKCSDSVKGYSILKDHYKLEYTENNLFVNLTEKATIPNIVRMLVYNDIDVFELQCQENDLEKLFMMVTNKNEN